MGKLALEANPEFLKYTRWLTNDDFSRRTGKQTDRLMRSDPELQAMLRPRISEGANLSLMLQVSTQARAVSGSLWGRALPNFNQFKRTNHSLWRALIDSDYIDEANNMLPRLHGVRKSSDLDIPADEGQKEQTFKLLQACYLPLQIAVEHGLSNLPLPGYLMGLADEWPVNDPNSIGAALRHEAGHIAAGLLPEDMVVGLNLMFARDRLSRTVLQALINAFEDNKVIRFQLSTGLGSSARDYADITIEISRRRVQSLTREGDGWMIPFNYFTHYIMASLAFEMAQDPDADKVKNRFENVYRKYVDVKNKPLIQSMLDTIVPALEEQNWADPQVFQEIFNKVVFWARMIH